MGSLHKILVKHKSFITFISLTIKRPIMTTPGIQAKVDKAAEELKANPYYEKYARKIASLQKTSPEEFLSRIEAQQTEKEPPKFGPNSDSARRYSSLLAPKKQLQSNMDLQEEPLDKIMKIDLIKDKDVSEISTIWKEYHLNKDYITASIPTEMYSQLTETATKYPIFLFPIPRSQGYEFIKCQFSKNTVHFTTLLNYQVHKENAPECLTIVHYTEFKEKGIVLMRGEFDKNVINALEAQCLANQLQLYYGQDDPTKIKLLESFTNKPDAFKHMELIGQIQTMSIN